MSKSSNAPKSAPRLRQTSSIPKAKSRNLTDSFIGGVLNKAAVLAMLAGCSTGPEGREDNLGQRSDALTNQPFTTANSNFSPHIQRKASDPDKIRVVWSTDFAGGAGGRDLVFVESTNGGMDWTAPALLPIVNTNQSEHSYTTCEDNKAYFISGSDGITEKLYETGLDANGMPMGVPSLVNTNINYEVSAHLHVSCENGYIYVTTDHNFINPDASTAVKRVVSAPLSTLQFAEMNNCNQAQPTTKETISFSVKNGKAYHGTNRNGTSLNIKVTDFDEATQTCSGTLVDTTIAGLYDATNDEQDMTVDAVGDAWGVKEVSVGDFRIWREVGFDVQAGTGGAAGMAGAAGLGGAPGGAAGSAAEAGSSGAGAGGVGGVSGSAGQGGVAGSPGGSGGVAGTPGGAAGSAAEAGAAGAGQAGVAGQPGGAGGISGSAGEAGTGGVAGQPGGAAGASAAAGEGGSGGGGAGQGGSAAEGGTGGGSGAGQAGAAGEGGSGGSAGAEAGSAGSAGANPEKCRAEVIAAQSDADVCKVTCENNGGFQSNYIDIKNGNCTIRYTDASGYGVYTFGTTNFHTGKSYVINIDNGGNSQFSSEITVEFDKNTKKNLSLNNAVLNLGLIGTGGMIFFPKSISVNGKEEPINQDRENIQRSVIEHGKGEAEVLDAQGNPTGTKVILEPTADGKAAYIDINLETRETIGSGFVNASELPRAKPPARVVPEKGCSVSKCTVGATQGATSSYPFALAALAFAAGIRRSGRREE